MSVDDVLKEIKGVQRFMLSRGSSPTESLLQSFSKSLVKMISLCGDLSPHDAAEINDALSHDSPYGADGTASIKAIIGKKVTLGAVEDAERKRSTGQSQLLKHWWCI